MEHGQEYRIYDGSGAEQEIDLKDLLFYILYRWWSLLLIAVLAGILAGGYAPSCFFLHHIPVRKR